MKDLFVVTHTQSVHHLENKVGGWYDTGLTPRGEINARATAERLASLVGDENVEIFSSDLLRASQTAAIIAKRLRQPVVETADLREISYGSAGGMPNDWLAERQTPAPDDNQMDHRGGIEDAETRRDIASRVYRCVESIVERPCEKQIIVTHGFALTFVIAAWIKMPLDAAGYVSFPARPGSITHLRQDDFWKSRSVISLAETSHLNLEAIDG
ncbi:histidine phosphatase family protein [Sinorhizobium meliloti]|uniref:histidine phosphatase family protein n=1 Tax=Rhizobium meliloti TaxID=382 RepID=UPI000FDA88DD|nr:histidine phosphatase family protein [Sinorhizobium meliloti]RVH51791.1 histidine phosphatase family protein [Sinorhizobium meliloti]